jgi:hypothetical protein
MSFLICDVAVHFFDFALHNLAILQYLYFDVALYSSLIICDVVLEVFHALGTGRGGGMGTRAWWVNEAWSRTGAPWRERPNGAWWGIERGTWWGMGDRGAVGNRDKGAVGNESRWETGRYLGPAFERR